MAEQVERADWNFKNFRIEVLHNTLSLLERIRDLHQPEKENTGYVGPCTISIQSKNLNYQVTFPLEDEKMLVDPQCCQEIITKFVEMHHKKKSSRNLANDISFHGSSAICKAKSKHVLLKKRKMKRNLCKVKAGDIFKLCRTVKNSSESIIEKATYKHKKKSK